MKEKVRPETLEPPGWLLLALEGRAPLEWSATIAMWPLLRMAPAGDGHPVIVFPGLGTGDFSTILLRNFLGNQGYATYGWDLGLNFGPRSGVLERSVERIRQIHRDTGRTVSLIGWSLGGIYAREFAKVLPKSVRSVITLGTPFSGNPKATNAWRLYEFASGHKLDDPQVLAQLREAPPAPTTSIFSRSDGVVAWPLSVQTQGSRSENVEVHASHIGLGMHPAALYAMADRLSHQEGCWMKFHRDGWRQWVYRDPDRRPAERD